MPAGEIAADETIGVWDVHWHAFAIFRSCGTQWRVVATRHALIHLGLDYAGVEAVMRNLLPDDADRRSVFADLMVMEAAALPILNEVTA